jgi:MFS transporter, DHA1 family, tetracycline resistance protein
VMKLEVHPRRWIVLGALISGIGFASVAGVQQAWQLPAAAPCSCASTASAASAWNEGKTKPMPNAASAYAAGTVAAAQGLGMVAGPMLGTLLYRGGPSLPYLLVGALLLLLCALAAAHRMKEIP